MAKRKISNSDLRKLAFLIENKLKEEFSDKHLSGNLMNTIEIIETDDSFSISIPAKTYNMLLFQTKGVIVHTKGSYASKLDTSGSEFFVYPTGTRKGSKKIYPKNHIGFVENVINSALEEWLQSISSDFKVKSRTDTGE